MCSPLLRAKLPSERGFLDEWMLAATHPVTAADPATWRGVVGVWGRPDRVRCLNAAERVLLELAAGQGVCVGKGEGGSRLRVQGLGFMM